MSTIDNLPPLRDVIARHDLRARKQLGQNFLLDLNLTGKIARQAGDLRACDVLEIGPGPGGLTRGLLAEGARHVLAIEKDARALPALAEIAAAYPGRLTVIHGDALQIDPLAHLTPPIRVAANLPYNVGTELLIRWLTPKDWPPFWSSLTLMFQKEVAERITATPGSKAYGRLALLAQWRAEARIVMTLPPEAFVRAKGAFGGGPPDRPAPAALSGRSGGPVTGHGRGLQPAPQDAAGLASGAASPDRGAAGKVGHRTHGAGRRDRSGTLLRPGAPPERGPPTGMRPAHRHGA